MCCTIQKPLPKAVSDCQVLSCRAGKGSWAGMRPTHFKVQPSEVHVTLRVAARAAVLKTSKPYSQAGTSPVCPSQQMQHALFRCLPAAAGTHPMPAQAHWP